MYVAKNHPLRMIQNLANQMVYYQYSFLAHRVY